MDEERIKELLELDEGEDEEEAEEIEEKESIQFPLANMEDFPDHKFATYEGQQLEDMVESIKQYGILEPILLWAHDGKHTIISGHNRKKAAVIAGKTTAPVNILRNLTLEKAALLVGESNFRQRGFSEMKPSNRAICLASHYKLMKAQGIRNDITDELKNLEEADNGAENSTCGKIDHKLKSRDKIGEEYGLNPRTVTRYIKIAELNETLLKYLDDGYLPFMAAYELSFIADEQCQQNLADYIYGGKKMSIGNAKKLRAHYEKKKSLTKEEIEQALAKPQGKAKPKGLQLKEDFLKRYFKGDNVSNQDMEDIIALALEAYFKKTEGTVEDENR